jgi:hypothetical protein
MTVQRISYIKRISVLVGAIATLLVALPAPAALGAADAAQNGYDEAPPLGDVRGATGGETGDSGTTGVTTPPAAEVSSSSAGLLPFTGLQIAIILLLGIALVGTGVLVRRATRVSSQ